MADVAAKVGTSIVEKVLTEVQKGPAQGSETPFSKLMSDRLDQHNTMMQQMMEVFGMPQDKQLQVKAISAEGLEISPNAVVSNQEIRTHGKALDLLSDVNRGALQLDNIIDVATSGRKFSPPELLALQAGVHQCALQIDLTGKILEQVNTGTKQLLQTNFA